MKVAANTSGPTLMGGDMAVVDMGISTNAEDQLMILNVLSNTLYTNKIAAVLREYGCNAYDANVEAGQGTRPIEVTLPNRLEAALRIRDFGYGMTEKQVTEVFCRLGRSTKRASNEFTGMLGIGSKAGFAYGDSFMVTSYTGGVRVVYNAFRDKGAPRLAKMHEGPTTEPDGIEIKVPVRQSDVDSFVITAAETYRYFKVHPKIGGAKIDLTRADVAVEAVDKTWRYTGNGESVAVMGNIGYHIDENQVVPYDSDGLRSLLDAGIELDFNIGDLEIAANREGLQYRDLTKNNITAALKRARKEIATEFTKKMASATSLWDAKMLYYELFERIGDSAQRLMRSAVTGEIKWNGKKIGSSSIDLTLQPKDDVTSIYYVVNNRWYRNRLDKRTFPSRVDVHPGLQLVLNDLPTKRNSPSRVKGWFDTKATAPSGSTTNLSDSLCVFTFPDDKAKDKFLQRVGLDTAPFILLSSITPAVTARTAQGSNGSQHRKKHSARAFTFDMTKASNPESMNWKIESIDRKDGAGVYVVIDKFSPVYNSHNTMSCGSFRNFIAQAREAGVVTADTIYGMKAELAAKAGPGWLTLTQHIEANLDSLPASFWQEYIDFDTADKFGELIKASTIAGMPRHIVPSGHMLREYAKALLAMRTPSKAANLRNLFGDGTRLGWWTTKFQVAMTTLPQPTYDLPQMDADIRAKYPMLDVASVLNAHYFRDTNDRSNTKTLTKVLDYIKLIDEQ